MVDLLGLLGTQQFIWFCNDFKKKNTLCSLLKNHFRYFNQLTSKQNNGYQLMQNGLREIRVPTFELKLNLSIDLSHVGFKFIFERNTLYKTIVTSILLNK